jgi:hypothetical protein
LFGAVAKLASINLRKLVLYPTSSINLGFILREDLLLCSSYLPLGVPNWADIYTPSGPSSSWLVGTIRLHMSFLSTPIAENPWLHAFILDMPQQSAIVA